MPAEMVKYKLRSPRGKFDLANGDILTLDDPPMTECTPDSGWRQHTTRPFLAHWIAGADPNDGRDQAVRGRILAEWVEPVEPTEEPKKECTCDIMITGCICRVFQREQEKGAIDANHR